MTASLLGFAYRFVPASGQAGADAPTLLVLHGTGGDENDLIPVGQALAPGAALLSPRGKVMEHGMPRFFRRLAEGVFDIPDLIVRTDELSGFVHDAAGHHRFDPGRVMAVGFSNGANIAASLLLRHPATLHGAVLFRPMVPFEPESLPDLTGKRVFIGAGRQDPLVPPSNTERLAAILRSAGADVTLAWQPGGHNLTTAEVDAARRWLAEGESGTSPGGARPTG